MSHYEYTLFDTAFGRCGLAWGGAGLRAVSFPEADDEKTIARLMRRAPAAAPAAPSCMIAELIEKITALFEGARADLTGADLDMSGIEAFDRSVYALALDIPAGETKTYGDLARALGEIAYSQRVGQSLGRNPFPIVVPCHRVVGADGRMTGFSAPGGIDAKRRLLKIEGALAPDLFDLAGE